MQNIKVFIIVIVFVDFPVIFLSFIFLLFDYGCRLPHSLLLQFKWLHGMYSWLCNPPSPHPCSCSWHMELNIFEETAFCFTWRVQRWHTRTCLKDSCFYSIIIYILYSLWTCAASIFPGIIVENEICYLLNYLDVCLQWVFITACLWSAIIHLTFIHRNDYDLNSRLQLSTRRNMEFELYL